MSDDQALVRAYDALGHTVDRIAAFLPIRDKFLSLLSVRPDSSDGDDIVWRLFQLRKKGKLMKDQTSRN